MRKKHKVIIVVILILVVAVVGLYTSYSYNNDNDAIDTNATYVASDEFLSINYLDGNYFECKKIEQNQEIKKRISITNVNKDDFFVTIALMDVNKKNNKIKIKLEDNNGVVLYDEYLGNFDTEILKTKPIESKKTLSYTLTVTNYGEEDLYGLTANIMVYRETSKKESTSFKDLILNHNKISTIQTPLGTESILNEGLIASEDDYGTSYYFRGKVDNNYVKIDDRMYRILRINGDESIRLISDEFIDVKSSYKNTINNMDYSSNISYENSDIKTKLETWYNDNLKDYDDYIIESTYCTDNSYEETEDYTKYFASYNRVMVDQAPTLKCMNNKEEYKIGLISIDEIIYAGASINKNNTSYYLYNDDLTDSWWTLSGSQVIVTSNVVDNFSINNQGAIVSNAKITTTMSIRPVFSIDKNISVTGSGTKEEPYIINK